MSRQHVTPLLLPLAGGATPLVALAQNGGDDAVMESEIQELVHAHPTCLPISEIDPIFVNPVPLCRELELPRVGRIDNFMVTPSGLPVLVECKLWRNAQARREVVGQILDYAKEIAGFTVGDLQALVATNLRGPPTALIDMVKAAAPQIDETEFTDALSKNLRRGRFLLLVVGDGIREGVEAISGFLEKHAGLHFSLGLVEMPLYHLPDGGRLVAPRILARTHVIARTVVVVPEGHAIEEEAATTAESEADPEIAALGDGRQKFWQEFLDGLQLINEDQPIPKAPRTGHIGFTLPAPQGTSWLTVYRDQKKQEVGLFLSSQKGTLAEEAMVAIADDWPRVRLELGGNAACDISDPKRPRIGESAKFGPFDQPEARAQALRWLAERTNTFINVLRPRVRAAVEEARERELT